MRRQNGRNGVIETECAAFLGIAKAIFQQLSSKRLVSNISD